MRRNVLAEKLNAMSTSVGRFPRIVLSLLAVAAAVYPFNRPDEQVVASPGEIGREQGAGLTPPQTRPRLPPPGSASNANSPRSLASWSRNRLAGTLERSVLAVGVDAPLVQSPLSSWPRSWRCDRYGGPLGARWLRC